MPNYENYDNEEEAKTLALDEYDKGKVNRPQFSRHSTAAFRTALHTLPAIAGY